MKRLLILSLAFVATCFMSYASPDSPYALGREIGIKIVDASMSGDDNDGVLLLLLNSIQEYQDSDKDLEYLAKGIEAGIYDRCMTYELGEAYAEELYRNFMTTIEELSEEIDNDSGESPSQVSYFDIGAEYGKRVIEVIMKSLDAEEYSHEFVEYVSTIEDDEQIDIFFRGYKSGIHQGCAEYNLGEDYADTLYTSIYNTYFGDDVEDAKQMGIIYGMRVIDEANEGVDLEPTISEIMEYIDSLGEETEQAAFFEGLKQGIHEGCKKYDLDADVADDIYNNFYTTYYKYSSEIKTDEDSFDADSIKKIKPDHYSTGKVLGNQFINLINIDGDVDTHSRSIGRKIDLYIREDTTSDSEANALFDGVKEGIKEGLIRFDLGTESVNPLYVVVYNSYRKSRATTDSEFESSQAGSSTPFDKGRYYGEKYVAAEVHEGNGDSVLRGVVEYINISNYTTEDNQDFIAGFKRGIYDGCERNNISEYEADQVVAEFEELIDAQLANIGTL